MSVSRAARQIFRIDRTYHKKWSSLKYKLSNLEKELRSFKEYTSVETSMFSLTFAVASVVENMHVFTNCDQFNFDEFCMYRFCLIPCQVVIVA